MAIKILNDLLPIAEQTEVGVVKPDNVSITITETGELQSSVVDLPEEVVTAENYDNPKLWKGTLEEYNAIETKNPLVTYIITDDNVETLKTTDYNALSNKPSINDVTLEGNKTLEDLNIQAADTALTTSQITNCITKIPQDIKLELNDGTLTLKAGSKVYVPNGFESDGITKKFDEVVIESDLSLKQQYDDNDMFVLVFNNSDGVKTLGSAYNGSTYETRPTAVGDYKLHYITSENKIFWDEPNHVSIENSLPIAIADRSADVGFTSIDQVFNGFGYMSNIIFALPDVEGLIPNGFSVDTKKLENIKVTTNKVTTFNVTDNTKKYILLGRDWFLPSAYFKYNNIQNHNYDSETHITLGVLCGTYTSDSTGRITSFTPKTVFQVVDRSDTEWASTASKPSDRYIDLTLGASDSTYSAPANGWVWLRKHVTEIGQYVELAGKVADICYSGRNNTVAEVYIPVKKNEMFRASYTAEGATVTFRFIYDEGVK